MMTTKAKEILREEAIAWHELLESCERELAQKSYTPYTYSDIPEEQELISTAVKVTRCVLKNGVMREGSEKQHYLYKNSCRSCAIEDYDPDVQDCISVAQLALINNALSEDAFHQALLAVNNYLRSLRAINLNATAQRTVYLDDLLNEGDVINVNNEIDSLVAEISIIESLRPIEKEVLKLWVKGYSVAQTGEKLHLKVKYELVNGKMKATCKAVETHRANIKKAVEKFYPDYARKVNK